MPNQYEDKELQKVYRRMSTVLKSYGYTPVNDMLAQLVAATEPLITQKQLEARIETVLYIDHMLRFENIQLHPVQAESLKQYIAQLEAQLKKGLQK